jgi:hypothetical protein
MSGNCEYRDLGPGCWHQARLDHERPDGTIDICSDGLSLTRIKVFDGPRDQTPHGMAYRSVQQEAKHG